MKWKGFRRRLSLLKCAVIIVQITVAIIIWNGLYFSYHKLESVRNSGHSPFLWYTQTGVVISDTKNTENSSSSAHGHFQLFLNMSTNGYYLHRENSGIRPGGLKEYNASQSKYARCIGKQFEWQAEDIFCLERPQYLSNYKNPCFFNASGQIRCGPYFNLLGVDKCGSTDLFNRILKHPEVDACNCTGGKEAYYWSWSRHGVWRHWWNYPNVRWSYEWYLDHFDLPAKYIQGNETDGYHRHITGDGSPMDFWDFRGWATIPQNKGLEEPRILIPHLMRHVYANPKFIVIFRNPTERLYSDYFFLHHGTSADTFHEDAIQAVAMMDKCIGEHSVTHCLYNPEFFRDLPMRIQAGCYAVFLKEWFSVFPRNNFLIIRTEDYHVRNKKHLYEVFNFLELRSLPDSEMREISKGKILHKTKAKYEAGPMRKDTRAILDNFYSSYNRQLADMLQDKRFLWEDGFM